MEDEISAIKEQVELSRIVVCKWALTILDVGFALFFSFLFGTQYLDQIRLELWQSDLQLYLNNLKCFDSFMIVKCFEKRGRGKPTFH